MRTVGAFYNALNDDPSLQFLSVFNQSVPITQFHGDERFGHAHGTDLRGFGEYEDMLGRTVKDIKALQLNQQAFEFYRLKVSSGKSFNWDDADCSSSDIPVILGSSYRSHYGIGDELEGGFYTHDAVTYRVIGFLEENSSLYYKGEVNYYLDEHMLIPYPQSLDLDQYGDDDFFGFLSFAMINSDIAAPKEMTSREVLARLDSAKSTSGFSDYTLLNIPSYLVQLSFMRQLLEGNLYLIATIQVLLAAVALIVIFFIDRSLCSRRGRKTEVWATIGDSTAVIVKRHGLFWLAEYAVILLFLLLVFGFLPNQDFITLFYVIGVLLCIAALDILFQYALLLRVTRRLIQ